MKTICWSGNKNEMLIRDRGVCFEQVLLILEQDKALDIVVHPNQARYPGQSIIIVEIDGYAYLVPYVEDEKEIFLKTIIPSRRATQQYLGKR